ncbi:LpqB [Serinicoccus hydrothermalis]|uniref:LpqB n=1 Tax=Serinicoccus hydrothermalis TaxID=1758689 RepID=A0A1B1NAE8_9MICO|nr:LpqB family beta-propeller domain-containing protein [Serinicoccus hydrothermalis]ANS78413.1 LpqB [Serinicoccus hydrothermalis]
MTWRTRLLPAALVLVLAGCSGQLPITPDPRPGLAVSQQSEREVERILPPARPGDTELEIVQGFLRAGEGFAGDNDVARTYLTSALASDWVPTANVTVYDGGEGLTLTRSADDEVSVEMVAVGRVDADGRLTEQTPRTTTVTFGLARVDGEPRISQFPDDAGLWLSDTEFARAFRPTTISYLNTEQDVFVPELRWLPDSEGLPTAVTRAQLAPLPAYLEGAVRTGASEGLRLATPAVPVDPSSLVATVNLQGATLAQDDALASDLSSQLAHSLLGLTTVAGVEVQVAGQPLPLDGVEGPITGATQLPYTDLEQQVDEVLLRVGEELTAVDPTQYALRDLPTDEGERLPTIGLDWSGIAASADLEDLAGVSTDGTSFRRWRGEEVSTNTGIGDELTAPAVDGDDAFWLGGITRSSGTPRIWAVETDDLDAVARPVEADWLAEDERVDGLSISPDGSRALVVVGQVAAEDEPQTHRVVLSGIVRDGQGRPTGLADPAPVAPHLQDVTSARWSGVGEVLIVGQRAGDAAPQPFRLLLGGWLEPLGELPDLVDAVPVPTTLGVDVVARTQDGGVYVPEGQSGWQPVRNADQVVVPGG